MDRQELDTVIYEKEGPVARIILNRPEKANAQNSAMVWDVDRCLTDAERDYDLKVLILKANGRGFCAGHEADPSIFMAPGIHAEDSLQKVRAPRLGSNLHPGGTRAAAPPPHP
jgi:enoyl-CoA hydratase/carnithine racemase